MCASVIHSQAIPVYLLPPFEEAERVLGEDFVDFEPEVRERDPPVERERELEPEAMPQSYARGLTFPVITGECPDIRMPRSLRAAGHSNGGREPLLRDTRGGVAWKLAIHQWSTCESNRARGKRHRLLPEVCDVVPSVGTHEVNYLALTVDELERLVGQKFLAKLES